jgi:poly(hydroxyalkanoate) granule-associated protein
MANSKKARGKRAGAPRSAASGMAAAQARMLDGMHQIWLAGLGAVAKAQRGAPRLLDELVAEGAKVHSKATGSARKAVRGAMHEAQAAINERLGDVRERAEDAYENLEKAFQTRVHRALHQLGVPSAEEVASLSKRVDALNANIGKLSRARKAAPRHARPRVVAETRSAPSATP